MGYYGGNPLFHKIWATMEEIHCFTKYGLLWRKSIVSQNMGYYGVIVFMEEFGLLWSKCI